ALFRLVEILWLRREVAHQSGGIVARPFEFLGMANRSGRAGLGAEPAIHTLADIDVEVGKLALLGFFIHFDADRDAGDWTVSFTGQAAGANIHIDFENAAISERQGFLDRHRNLVRILDRHRPPHEVRKGDRHPLEGGCNRLADIFSVAYDVHNASMVKYAVSNTTPAWRDESETPPGE